VGYDVDVGPCGCDEDFFDVGALSGLIVVMMCFLLLNGADGAGSGANVFLRVCGLFVW
jgi:hypothetical protein